MMHHRAMSLVTCCPSLRFSVPAKCDVISLFRDGSLSISNNLETGELSILSRRDIPRMATCSFRLRTVVD